MNTFKFSRKIDELGRVVLPIEMRKALNLQEKDSVVISLDEENNTIILSPERDH